MVDQLDAAILAAIAADPRPTVRSVAARLGLGTEKTWRRLSGLRDGGLVAWEDGRRGTLRVNLTAVAHY